MTISRFRTFAVPCVFLLAAAAHAQFGAKIFGQANSSVFDFVPSDKLDYSTSAGNAFVEAHADMHTGIMRGLSRAAPGTDHNYAIFNDRLSDNLTVTGEGTDPVEMTIGLDVAMTRAWDNLLGNMQSEDMIGNARLEVLSGAQHVVSQYHSQFSRTGSLDGEGHAKIDELYNTGFVVGTGSVLEESHDAFHVVMTATLMVKPGDEISLILFMQGSAQGDKGPGCVVDALHSGHASVMLPTGYGFTSQAGGFLDQPVPEPSTLAALGLGAVAVLRQRRRR